MRVQAVDRGTVAWKNNMRHSLLAGAAFRARASFRKGDFLPSSSRCERSNSSAFSPPKPEGWDRRIIARTIQRPPDAPKAAPRYPRRARRPGPEGARDYIHK